MHGDAATRKDELARYHLGNTELPGRQWVRRDACVAMEVEMPNSRTLENLAQGLIPGIGASLATNRST
jgi:hypothetical protein